MNMPGFNAESSFGPTMGIYRGKAVFGRSGTVEVLPMLEKLCGNCETVGALGSIRGIGLRSCCEKMWEWNPITEKLELTSVCWFERCTPEAVRSPWLAF
ncbi:MAG: hypothetical protein L6Q53_18095 [Candidatus Brocadia sinica]|nr:hypothetical protein [Candidatus Brocadia sinica]